MSGDEMDRRIRDWARDYNRPPATPREEIWAGLSEALRSGAERAPSPEDGDHEGVEIRSLERARPAGAAPSGPPWLAWASAAAAVLALGVGIGRMTAPRPDMSSEAPAGVRPVITAEGTEDEGRRDDLDGSVRTAAMRHLDRTETLLGVLRADAGAGRLDPTVARWGRGLLLETRLLLDAADTSDPELRGLLEDLELILVQVVLLAGEDPDDEVRGREELRLIADGLEERDVLTRIRAVLSESDPVIL